MERVDADRALGVRFAQPARHDGMVQPPFVPDPAHPGAYEPTPEGRGHAPAAVPAVPWVGKAIAGSVLLAVSAAMAAVVYRDDEPLAIDRWAAGFFDRIDDALPTAVLRVLTFPGSLLALVAAMAALLWWAERQHDRRLTAFIVFSPLVTIGVGQALGKPLIGRNLGNAFAFPSGHASSATAIAAITVVALRWPSAGPRSERHRRWAPRLSVAVCVAAGTTAVAIVTNGWHVFTDSVAGVLFAVGAVLAVAAVCANIPADRPLIRRLALRRGAYVLSGACIALLGSIRVPYIVLSPGSLIPLNTAISVGEDTVVEAGPLHGTYSGLTVRATSLTIAGWVWYELRGSSDDIVRREAVIPPGEDGQEYRRQQRQVFVDASEVAVAVAEQALGRPVSISGDGAAVTAIQPDGPVDGRLEVGEVIVEVGGRAVSTDEELRAALAAVSADAGFEPLDPVDAGDGDGGGGGDADADQLDDARIPTTVVVRDAEGETRTEAIELRRLEQTGRFGLGIGVSTANLRFEFATEVSVDGGQVGGPSAGLLTALAVYDTLSDDDVAAGRHITGTGTLSLNGNVGIIGGIEEKVRAAIEADADVFLVPEAQLEQARDAADGRIDVIAVGTFEQALEALQAA